MQKPDTPRERPLPSDNDLVDETSSESFPASDPPGWSHLHVGTPVTHTTDDPERRRDAPPAGSDSARR